MHSIPPLEILHLPSSFMIKNEKNMWAYDNAASLTTTKDKEEKLQCQLTCWGCGSLGNHCKERGIMRRSLSLRKMTPWFMHECKRSTKSLQKWEQVSVKGTNGIAIMIRNWVCMTWTMRTSTKSSSNMHPKLMEQMARIHLCSSSIWLKMPLSYPMYLHQLDPSQATLTMSSHTYVCLLSAILMIWQMIQVPNKLQGHKDCGYCYLS